MMKRLTLWITMGFILSGILVSPMKVDGTEGIKKGDSFQLTIEFAGDLRKSYTLPHTNLKVNNREQPLIVDYTIIDILTNTPNGTFIQFDVKSEILTQNPNVFISSTDLIESYVLSNKSNFQPPPVISVDFKDQFDRFFTYINEDIKGDNSTILLDFGYTNDIDYYEIYFSTNYSNILDTRSFQEIIMQYSKGTGILESYHNLILFKDDTQGIYADEVIISNTSQSTITKTETSISSSNIVFVILIIILLVSLGGYFVFKSKLTNNSPPIPEIEVPQRAITPNNQTTDHYETLLTERSKVKIQPQVVKRILCPTCNTVNMLDSKYCLECGTYISY